MSLQSAMRQCMVLSRALAMSGTVTTELALLGIPTLVCFKTDKLTELLARALAKVDYVSVLNLLAGKELLPELLFDDFTVKMSPRGCSQMYLL